MTGIHMALAGGERTFVIELSGTLATGGCGASSGTCQADTGTLTVTVLGGVGPFNYSWAHTGGTAFTALSSTSATSAFRRTANVAGSPTLSGTGTLTVTDTGDSNRQRTASFTVETTHTQTA